MVLLLEFCIGVLVIAIAYWWYKHVIEVRNKLKWCEKRPGIPLIGNSLEFSAGPTEHLNKLMTIIKEQGKIANLEFVLRQILIITDYKLTEFILSSNSLTLLDKTEDYEFLHKWLGTGLLTSTGPKWKTRRRILTPAFHFQILEQFIEVFETNGTLMVEKLNKEVGKDSVDIYTYVTLCTLDIICETAMGVSINAQQYKESDYVQSVKKLCRILVDRSFSPIEMFDTLYLFTKNCRTEKESLKIVHSHTNDVINKRRVELEKKGTKVEEDDTGVKKKVAFLDLLLQANVDGKPLSQDDIREEVDTFMFEGHDTTASAISFALYLLANHADVQKKAFDEQKLIFGDDLLKVGSYRELQDMKYLELVIKEALRLYPSVPFYGRRVLEDITYLDGQILPKDTTLVLFAYGINRDPEYYENPNVFNPERFKSIDGKLPYSYIPFSAGPRNCIGQKFAVLEMKSTISKMIRNFELLPSIPEHTLKLTAETVLKSANGIKLRLKKR